MAEEDTILRPLGGEDEVEELLDAPLALLYKHSPHCWRSFMAVGQVRRFALEREDVPVWMVDVVARRELSRALAGRLGVVHQSPQVILLRQGRALWDASHLSVRHGSIVAAVEETGIDAEGTDSEAG